MIGHLRGTLSEVTGDRVTVEAGGVGYAVFVSESLGRELLGQRGKDVELCTYYYLQGSGMGNALPTLIGFRTRLDREFFEQFITVSGIGPRAAVRALTLPVSEIAAAIEAGNRQVLESLPGIGRQRATEIVAKLQGKVAMAPVGEAVSRPVAEDVAAEALVILTEQLGYGRGESERLIREAFARRPGLKTVEDLIRDIYQHRSDRPPSTDEGSHPGEET